MHKVGVFPKILPKPKSGLKKEPIWATRKVCSTSATLLFKKATSPKPNNGYKKPKPQDTHKPTLPCNKSMPLLQTNNRTDVIRIKNETAMNTKTIFTICLLLLGAIAMQAQEQELKRFRDDNGKWGYKDQNGKVIIAPKYFLAYDFS